MLQGCQPAGDAEAAQLVSPGFVSDPDSSRCGDRCGCSFLPGHMRPWPWPCSPLVDLEPSSPPRRAQATAHRKAPSACFLPTRRGRTHARRCAVCPQPASAGTEPTGGAWHGGGAVNPAVLVLPPREPVRSEDSPREQKTALEHRAFLKLQPGLTCGSTGTSQEQNLRHSGSVAEPRPCHLGTATNFSLEKPQLQSRGGGQRLCKAAASR